MRSVSSCPPPPLSHCWETQWTAGSPTTSTWGCRTLSRWTSTSLRLARRWFSKIWSIILLSYIVGTARNCEKGECYNWQGDQVLRNHFQYFNRIFQRTNNSGTLAYILKIWRTRRKLTQRSKSWILNSTLSFSPSSSTRVLSFLPSFCVGTLKMWGRSKYFYWC